MMNFLYRTKDDVLKFSVDGSYKIKWYVDAAFAVHPDMKSHTGAVMTKFRDGFRQARAKQYCTSLGVLAGTGKPWPIYD